LPRLKAYPLRPAPNLPPNADVWRIVAGRIGMKVLAFQQPARKPLSGIAVIMVRERQSRSALAVAAMAGMLVSDIVNDEVPSWNTIALTRFVNTVNV
jgi:hypothetical protein